MESAESQPLTQEEILQAKDDRIKELEEALYKEINFSTAKDLREREIWLYVVDALNLRMAIRKESEPSINKDRAFDKLIFTVGDDGRVTDVKGPGEVIP